jgi:hypothetical protein
MAQEPRSITTPIADRARAAAERAGRSAAGQPSPAQAAPPRSRAPAILGTIGGAAGFTGGLLQPTHSNGEYVLGSSRVGSALALGAIGAGIGAVIGIAVAKTRD